MAKLVNTSLAYKWQAFGGAVVCGALGYTMIPVLWPQKTKLYHTLSKEGLLEPVEVDDVSLKVVSEVLTKLKMPKDKVSQIDLYVTQTVEPNFHGQLSLQPKSLIGLPRNLGWQTPEDVELGKEKILNKSFPWSSPRAEDVKAFLLLSQAEKEFLVARQIGYIDCQHIWSKLTWKMVCIMTWFYGSYFVSGKLGHFDAGRKATAKKHSVLILNFIMPGIAAALVHILILDNYNCNHDKWADRYAGLMGADMCLAGYNYYDKQIKANKALYELSPGADKTLTPNGNFVVGAFRTKHLALSSRKNYMKKMYDNFMKKQEEAEQAASESAEIKAAE